MTRLFVQHLHTSEREPRVLSPALVRGTRRQTIVQETQRLLTLVAEVGGNLVPCGGPSLQPCPWSRGVSGSLKTDAP